MQYLDWTSSEAAGNIAADEALLLDAEQRAASGHAPTDVLRIWESADPIVVVGRGSRVESEVDVETCHRDNVPILRRSSGGTTIVAASGCLMYAVVVSYAGRPHLKAIDQAHAHVLDQLVTSLSSHIAGVHRQGTSDLAVGDLKFSGNALRCRRTHLLYHGTLLYDMDLDLVSRYLKTPPREPEYRDGRAHAEFIRNLPLDRGTLRAAVIEAYGAKEPLQDWPQALTVELVAEKYSQDDWNFRLR